MFARGQRARAVPTMYKATYAPQGRAEYPSAQPPLRAKENPKNGNKSFQQIPPLGIFVGKSLFFSIKVL